LALGLTAAAARAQDSVAEVDATGDIIISLPNARAPLPTGTRHELDSRAIDVIAADAADEIVRRLPSVHVAVNSRGEAIAFVRSAAERQVAVFYEGAAINVPWDNRLDLSMFPSGLAGSALVAAAPLAPRYGVNALGAVSFAPPRPVAPTAPTARAMLGSAGIRDIQASVPFVTGATEVLIGGSYAARDGETLADDVALPFSQAGDRRLNTDRELASVFGRIGTMIGDHRLSLTAFHVDAEKGIAPESDRPSGARFWRYPSLQHSLVTAKAGLVLGETTALDLIGWYQRFNQTIDSYTSAAYDRRDTQEVDRDRTVGARALLTQRLGAAQLVASANVLDSTHDQRDTSFVAGAAPAQLPAFLHYRQRNVSLGLDLSTPLSDQLSVDLGGGYDRVEYLDTGDKPGLADVGGWAGRAGLAWTPSDAWRLRASVGRKIRAPTMRELFGQALNRFLLNLDLQPERIISGEVGAEWHDGATELSLVGFAQDLDGTIDQRNVGRLRQRINLPGTTVLGVEAAAQWHPAAGWSIGGSGTLSRTRRKQVAAGETDRLAEKPEILARVFGDYAAASGFGALAELLYVSRAYSADVDGVLVALPRSASLNLRVSQRVAIGSGGLDLFMRGDNVTDSEIVPQLGLPAPGRTIRLGVAITAW
jgi:iron complex outermembrane receptor protein